jgi:hypothetical protein
MMGRARHPRVSPAERRQGPNPRKTAKKESPKRPNTTDGTPARLRMARRTVRVKRSSRAYSTRYTAVATPMGKAKAMETKMSWKVPTMAG